MKKDYLARTLAKVDKMAGDDAASQGAETKKHEDKVILYVSLMPLYHPITALSC